MNIKILAAALFTFLFCQLMQAQNVGRIVIKNANTAYPKFMVSLNGVRISNDFGHAEVFNYVDEAVYRVKIVQIGSTDIIKFNVSSEPKYESKYLIMQDNVGNWSLVLQSKSLIINNQPAEEDEDEIPKRNGGSTQVIGSKIPQEVIGQGNTQVVVNPVPVVVTVVQAPAPPPVPVAMTNEVYNRKYNEVKAKTFDNEKLERAKQAFDNEKMNVNQVIGIMRMFNFDDEKVNFAKFAYSRTIDKSEYYRTYDLITFTFTRQDFENWVNGQKK